MIVNFRENELQDNLFDTLLYCIITKIYIYCRKSYDNKLIILKIAVCVLQKHKHKMIY